MYCQECGSEINEDSIVCQSCGTKVVAEVSEGPTSEVLVEEVKESSEIYSELMSSTPTQKVVDQKESSYEPIKLSQWLLTFLILMVPIVNLVMPFVWAFGSDTHPSKRTFFQAYLIFSAIAIVLWFALVVIMARVFSTIADPSLFY
jgi:RNA polymerase subunit RPABC4/transcription elongation factor Spt4